MSAIEDEAGKIAEAVLLRAEVAARSVLDRAAAVALEVSQQAAFQSERISKTEQRKVQLLENVRMLCIFLILLGVGLAGQMLALNGKVDRNDRHGAARVVTVNAGIKDVNTALGVSVAQSKEVAAKFDRFSLDNQNYLDNHAKTQRLICYTLRLHHEPLPDNGDCDGR